MTGFLGRIRIGSKLAMALLFFLVLTMLFVYRQPIAIKSIEYFTKPKGVQLTCMNFSLDWQFTVNIKQACVKTPLGRIQIKNALWRLWTNELSVENISVKHVRKGALENAKEALKPAHLETASITIPDYLPYLSVERMDINSFELRQPIQVRISQSQYNELTVTGDLNISIQLQEHSLTGTINWALSDLTKFIPQAQSFVLDNTELLKSAELDKSRLNTKFSFDGHRLSLDNHLDIDSRLHISKCAVDAHLSGNILVSIDMGQYDLSADMTALSSNFQFPSCQVIQSYLPEEGPLALSLVVPKILAVNSGNIFLPALTIADDKNQGRNVSFSALTYERTGEFAFDYNISIEQSLAEKYFDEGLLSLQAEGHLFADFSKLSKLGVELPVSWRVTSDRNILSLSNIKQGSMLIDKLIVEFSLASSDAYQLKVEGEMLGSEIKMDELKLVKMASGFSLSGAGIDNLAFSFDSEFLQLNHTDLLVEKWLTHVDANIKKFNDLTFRGESDITGLSVQGGAFLPVRIEHSGQMSLADTGSTYRSQHDILIEEGFSAHLKQQPTHLTLRVEQQNLNTLQNIASQWESELQINQGNISAEIVFPWPQGDKLLSASGSMGVRHLQVDYKNYLIHNLTYETPLIFDSAGLQLAESNLGIDFIDTGVKIEQLQGKVAAQDSAFRLKNVRGNIFGGQFSVGEFWLDGREQQVNIDIQAFDLAQLVAIQKQPGIQITGNINGDMPLVVGSHGIKVDGGWVTSKEGGKLSIVNNPSFDSIKVQQPQLALLENMDFTQLESKVRLNPDGWMFLDFSIQGNNPDEKQSVNLNYSHEENIFSLLESIRLVDSVEDKIEQKITQGGGR